MSTKKNGRHEAPAVLPSSPASDTTKYSAFSCRRCAVLVLRRLLRWLDPAAFFSEDASLEIDRLRERLEVGK